MKPRSFVFIWKYVRQKSPGIFGSVFSLIPILVSTKLLSAYMLPLLIDFTCAKNETKIVCFSAAFACAQLLLWSGELFFTNLLATQNYRFKMQLVGLFVKQYMRLDYEIIESAQGKFFAQQAQNTLFGADFRNKPMVESYTTKWTMLLANILGICTFGGIIALLNPWLLGLLVFVGLITWLLQFWSVKKNQRDRNACAPIDRKIRYIIKESKSLSSEKEIKLYGMQPMLKRIFSSEILQLISYYRKRGFRNFGINAGIAVVTAGFNLAIYAFLLRNVLNGTFLVTEFVLYFSMISNFSSYLLSLINSIEEIHDANLAIGDLIAFLSLKSTGASDENMSDGSAPPDVSPPIMPEIRFSHVDFSYPGVSRNIITDLNLTIKPGEKIAIVGKNGAGKSTFIKLLCGLYTPTKGDVFINDRNMRNISTSERIRLISAVFQDIYLIPTTVEQNISVETPVNTKKFAEAVSRSSFNSVLCKLKNGKNTNLVRSVLDDAVELSGGEMQKLALARALYHGGSIFILDEPTAAMDPVAESEVYQSYQRLTDGKTSVFVSHRLASTSFCDRIFLLDNGKIAECGTHNELIALGGKYATMFEVQRKYYKAKVNI